MQWNLLRITDPGHWIWAGLEPTPWVYFVHSYAARGRAGHVVDVRLRRRGGRVRGTRQPGRHAVPPGEVGPQRPAHPVELHRRLPSLSLEGTMQLYPAIDLRNGNCVRLYQGDFARETAYGERSGRPGSRSSPTRGPSGSTWSTSTRPAPARRTTCARSGPSRPGSGPRSSRAAGCATSPRPRRCTRRASNAWSSVPPRSRTRTSCVTWRVRTRDGSPSGSMRASARRHPAGEHVGGRGARLGGGVGPVAGGDRQGVRGPGRGCAHRDRDRP